MADEKFTPGPWETGGLSRLSIFSGAKHIAYTLWGYGTGEDAARKNANLIAAAPELYAVVEAFGNEEISDAEFNRMRNAALAKARGEAV